MSPKCYHMRAPVRYYLCDWHHSLITGKKNQSIVEGERHVLYNLIVLTSLYDGD